MGIPPDIEYGEDCLTCYDIGLTPRYLFMEVTGIEKGQGWIAGDGEPANGTWRVEQQPGFPCFWEGTIDAIPALTVLYYPIWFLNTLFSISNDQFSKQVLGVECAKEGDSNIVDGPGIKFFGGHAIIYDSPGGEVSELLAVADLVAIPIVDEMRFENYQYPPGFNIYRIAGCFGKTNIYIKKEIP